MFCPKCGYHNHDSDQPCEKCGHDLLKPVAMPTAATLPGGYALTSFRTELPVLYAGFWLRMGAYLVDCLILLIPIVMMKFIAEPLVSSQIQGNIIGAAISNIIITNFVVFIYYGLLESSEHQATYGKRIVGIKVTDLQNQQISFWRAGFRYLGFFAWSELIGIGSYLMTYTHYKILGVLIFAAFSAVGVFLFAFTEKKQGLHDLVTSCLVVKR